MPHSGFEESHPFLMTLLSVKKPEPRIQEIPPITGFTQLPSRSSRPHKP